MKHLALFNGIGGFQLAANWMGWENVAHVEIDDWPTVQMYRQGDKLH